jgi:hypothetical protein
VTTTNMQIPLPKRWEPLSLVAIAAGFYWLVASHGFFSSLLALIPGGLLFGSGAALLLVPGNPRITAYMALGSVAGVLASLVLLFTQPWVALLCGLFSAACYLVAGRVSLDNEPLHEGAPAPDITTQMNFKAALDEVVLGYFIASAKLPSGIEAERLCEQAQKLETDFRERGWDVDPTGFNPAPPPPEDVRINAQRDAGVDYELLSWDSGYAPDAELPVAAAYRDLPRNNRYAARVLRHPGVPRPWLLCIHGYRMGAPLLDFSLFNPQWLHHRLGFNLIQPILPLHGMRASGVRSGDQFLDGNPLDLVYAEAHCLWDLRRTLAWLRQQEENPRIGVYGLSLGGYNASLLASYDAGLDFVVAGIPVIDFASALYRFMPPSQLRYLAAKNMDEARYRTLLRVVSPLARPPLIAKEHLHIFAGTGDRIVLPHHPVQLARHWEVPINWFQGSHLSIRYEPMVAETLREAVLRADWPTAR